MTSGFDDVIEDQEWGHVIGAGCGGGVVIGGVGDIGIGATAVAAHDGGVGIGRAGVGGDWVTMTADFRFDLCVRFFAASIAERARG